MWYKPCDKHKSLTKLRLSYFLLTWSVWSCDRMIVWRKIQTKVTFTPNQNKGKFQKEPIRTQIKTRENTSRDWFWLWIWLVEKVKGVLDQSQSVAKQNQRNPRSLRALNPMQAISRVESFIFEASFSSSYSRSCLVLSRPQSSYLKKYVKRDGPQRSVDLWPNQLLLRNRICNEKEI